jgi:UDP-N-acetyl-D-mannosaminuronate dehydrogenase
MDSSVDAVIVGLGYVGLPFAREACVAGLSVVGLMSILRWCGVE